MALDFQMHAERTPNPNSIKWVFSRHIVDGDASAFFESPPSSEISPLASALFAIEGVVGVFFAANFTTVTKRDDVDWADIAQLIVDAINTHLTAGQPTLGPAYQSTATSPGGPLAARIRRLLDEEIRPSVAMDGGDVLFVGFHEGRVELRMRGACSGCPSATATLKIAIEARLREVIPEVQEVVAVC